MGSRSATTSWPTQNEAVTSGKVAGTAPLTAPSLTASEETNRAWVHAFHEAGRRGLEQHDRRASDVTHCRATGAGQGGRPLWSSSVGLSRQCVDHQMGAAFPLHPSKAGVLPGAGAPAAARAGLSLASAASPPSDTRWPPRLGARAGACMLPMRCMTSSRGGRRCWLTAANTWSRVIWAG